MIKSMAPLTRPPVAQVAPPQPNVITVVSQLGTFLADAALGTVVATLRLDGGAAPLYNGTWSAPAGSNLAISGSGQTVNVVVQASFVGNTGNKSTVVSYTGGEMGAGALTAALLFTVNPVVLPALATQTKTATTGQLTNVAVLTGATAGSYPIDVTKVVVSSAPTHGIATAQADGTVNYTATSPYTGPDSFSCTVKDTNGNTSPAAITSVTVQAVVPGTSPPTSLTVVSVVDPQFVGAPLGTVVATLRLDGGVTPLYNSTWSFNGGLAQIVFKTPNDGHTVDLVIGTVIDDTLIGSRHRDVKVTGGELGATVLSATVNFTVAAALSAYSLANPAGKPYTQRWSTWIGTGASITALATGVKMSAGPAAGGDANAIQMWCKTPFNPTAGTKIVFKAKRKDPGIGAANSPAMLFYWATVGDGTAGHPADPSSWAATAATRWEFSCFGMRSSFGPRKDTDNVNDDQIRTRKQIANGGLGTSVLDSSSPENTSPGSFPFGTDVTYQCETTILNGVFTFTYTNLADATDTQTISQTDVAYSVRTTGYLGWRAMESCDFEITDYDVSEIAGDGGGGGGGSFFDDEVVAAQAAPTVTNVATYADFVKAVGTLVAGERIVLANGTYDGADNNGSGLAITAPNTVPDNNPVIICCNGDAGMLKAILRFKLVIKGKNLRLWGLKFTRDDTNKRSGRVQWNGATKPVVERCEFTGWMPNDFGAAGHSAGHAIEVIGGGDGGIIRRCFIHDPGPYKSAEITPPQIYSDRIFIRVTGGDCAAIHTNGLIEKCWIGSTIERPQPGNKDKGYKSGQTDLLEIGGNGPSYPGSGANACLSGWIVQDNLFDGTGEGGPPTGFPGLVLNGDIPINPSGVVDTKVSKVWYLRNTFKNFRKKGDANATVGRAEIRFGEQSAFNSNYCDVATLSCQGGKHHFLNNKIVNDGQYFILTGSIEWNAYADGHQRSDLVVLQDNFGTAKIGNSFGGIDIIPARATRILGKHNGDLVLSNNGGPYTTIPAALVTGNVSYKAYDPARPQDADCNEINSFFSLTRDYPQQQLAVEVAKTAVGPFSV